MFGPWEMEEKNWGYEVALRIPGGAGASPPESSLDYVVALDFENCKA
jgi:hypothetical protein